MATNEESVEVLLERLKAKDDEIAQIRKKTDALIAVALKAKDEFAACEAACAATNAGEKIKETTGDTE